MVLPTDLINEFEDVDTTTNDDQNDTDTDVEDTSTDDDSNNDNDEDTNDDGNDKSGDDNDDKGSADDAGDNKDDKNVDDEEGYFADDDADDSVDTPTDKLPDAPASFTPEEKYIVDNLPLITVRVRLADDSIKTMQVRSAADLPRDMKGIATPYEDKQFDLANAAQETRARELQTYYRQHQTQLQAQEFEKKENQSIRDDIADLQREGEIPKFKAQPGTKAFENDPAAKLVQEVIEFMNERNDKYLADSNNGKAYKHIGFAEAFELHAKAPVDKNSSTRKEAANKLKTRQGSTPSKAPKTPVSGRTLKEVAAEFDNFEN
jgi:hypothetical protein